MARHPKNRIVLASAAAVLLTLALVGWNLHRNLFYPVPERMPPATTHNVEKLLTQLEATLKTKAPAIIGSFQPGLADSQITALEEKAGMKLSSDMRALYRWRNGSASKNLEGFIPGHRFVPLEEAVESSDLFRQKVKESTFSQRVAHRVFTAHRAKWLVVFDDGAGDGYFYDSGKSDIEGAFFYHVAEVGYYRWFPAVGNFIGGVVECYEAGAIKASGDGMKLEENFEQSQEIWEQVSAAREE